MERGLYIAASGMVAGQIRQDQIANDLATGAACGPYSPTPPAPAVQNRLEHTIANLGTLQENTQAAESRIRDVDMAKEMVNFTKLNILQQAGTSMLAQANQSSQGVLSLLRG